MIPTFDSWTYVETRANQHSDCHSKRHMGPTLMPISSIWIRKWFGNDTKRGWGSVTIKILRRETWDSIQDSNHSRAQCSVSSQVRPTVLKRSASVSCLLLEKYPAAILASISTRESGGMRWSKGTINFDPNNWSEHGRSTHLGYHTSSELEYRSSRSHRISYHSLTPYDPPSWSPANARRRASALGNAYPSHRLSSR